MFIQKIIDVIGLKTYSVGLYQAKAYRILKYTTAKALEAYQLSSLDWAVLGLLYDHKPGLKSTEIAELVGVEPSFVTVLIDELSAKKLVLRKESSSDRRTKLITLTPSGRRKIPIIETTLREATKGLLKGTSATDLMAYLRVLKTIIENSKN